MTLGSSGCGGGERPPSGDAPQPLGASRCGTPEATDVDFCLLDGVAHRNDFYGSGVALIDVNGDGVLDLFAGGDAFASLFAFGNGDGGFTEATSAVGLDGLLGIHGVAPGDFDNDGDVDLYLTSQQGNLLFRNDGGVFVNVTESAGVGDSGWGTTAAFGDYDGDGLLDLYVGNWADYLGTSAPQANVLYHNEGGGLFRDATAEAGVDGARFTTTVAMSDADDDGDLDLFEGDDFGVLSPRTRFFRSDGGDPPALVDEPAAGLDLGIYAMNVTAADYDRDGDLDYYLTNIGCNVLAEQRDGAFVNVARDRGAGLCDTADDTLDFAYTAADAGSADADERAIADYQARYVADPTRPALTSWAAVFLDFDQDGWEDLFVADGQVLNDARVYQDAWLQPNALLHNEGGTFAVSDGGGVASAQTSRGATAGDLDGDGDLDLVVSQIDFSGPPVPALLVYRNQAARGNWLIVELEGGARDQPNGLANRDGIGARVEIDAAGQPPIVRERTGGGGYLGPPEAQLHVGLGDATTVDVTVTWPAPSRTVDHCIGVAANQHLLIREGDCP